MMRLLYTVGTGYSGSTLFSFLLNGHPEIASVGEATGPLRDPLSYPCSCGKELPLCDFWRSVATNMRDRGFSFGPDRWDLDFRMYKNRILNQFLSQSLRSRRLDAIRDALVFRVPRWKKSLTAAGRRNDAFVESVLRAAGKPVFMDASKDPVRARYLLRLSAAEIRVIHLVRDAPGFVCSFMKNRGYSLGTGIRYWTRTVGHVTRLQAGLRPEHFLRIQYEELCTSTNRVLDRVAHFAGVGPFQEIINFKDSAHHVIGNRMRMASSGEIVLDEKWRDRLTRGQLDEILRRTSATRRVLNYSEER